MDDREDEDGADDIDRNGVITVMRARDPEGEWLALESEPRLMKKADPDKGEKGLYKLYPEGVDNDGDGQYGEDGPGGANVGVNFPHLFRYFSKDGGQWAGSESESLGLIRFVFQHPRSPCPSPSGKIISASPPPVAGARVTQTSPRSRSQSTWAPS